MPLSAYELERAANIAANKAKLVELGIENPITVDKKAARPIVKGAAANKKPKRELAPPRARSLRQQNLGPFIGAVREQVDRKVE